MLAPELIGRLGNKYTLTIARPAEVDAVSEVVIGTGGLALGADLLREPDQLLVLMAAVALLTVQGFVINRLAGIPYPAWSPRPAPD